MLNTKRETFDIGKNNSIWCFRLRLTLDLLVFRLSDAARPFFTTRCEIYSVSTRVTFHEKTDDIISRVETNIFCSRFQGRNGLYRDQITLYVNKIHLNCKFSQFLSSVGHRWYYPWISFCYWLKWLDYD